MVQQQRNKSIKETKKEGRCTNCVMNTICTFANKEQKGRSGHCPSSIKNLPPIKSPAKIGMEKMGYSGNTQEPTDMIPVIKMEYWDGSKFIVRTDKAGYKKILCKLRVKMRSKLLDLPIEEQIEIGKKQTMLKQTEENMSEEEYLKIDKG